MHKTRMRRGWPGSTPLSPSLRSCVWAALSLWAGVDRVSPLLLLLFPTFILPPCPFRPRDQPPASPYMSSPEPIPRGYLTSACSLREDRAELESALSARQGM